MLTLAASWPGLAVLLVAAPLATPASAGTLEVPAQYPTIQAAIVEAQPGDTVLVAPGTYLETIDFLGKAITVQSSGGAAVTTIDGGGAGSVVSFVSGEPAGTTLRGFTITGGTGTLTTFGLSPSLEVGGGIRILSSSPEIDECVISGNTSPHYGGGVFVGTPPFTSNAQPTFVACLITDNSTTAPSPQPRDGGGIAAINQAFVVMTDCTIASNSSAGSGGGFYASGRAGMQLTHVSIEGNSAVSIGGGGAYSSGQEVGFSLFMTDCTVTDNTASSLGATGRVGLGGGGLYLSTSAVEFGFPPTAWLRSCRITANSSDGSGGGIYATGSGFLAGVHVRSCLIAQNSCALSGGGVRAEGRVFLTGNTIAANDAGSAGGLFATNLSSGPSNCIIWNNAPDQYGGSFAAQWCDIQGGYAGTGNIDIDPHFVAPSAGDFHLAPTSACVDAGSPTFTPSPADETDIDGDPRVLFGRIDIGADEATVPKGPWTFLGHALAGASGAPTLVGTGALTPGSPMSLSLQDALPASVTFIVAGTGALLLPFKGGVMVPTLDMLIGPVGSGPSGGYTLGGSWPPALPPGFVVRLQAWIADASGPAGFTASNGLAAESQ